jgi:dTDP-4-amino-4,6-dideoxygalactose transaminase
MSELAGAVGLAQVRKLPEMIERRVRSATALSARLGGVEGLNVPIVRAGDRHSYWRYAIRVGPHSKAGLDLISRRLKDDGIACTPRYIQKPAFDCAVFREQRTFGRSRFPFSLARKEAVAYSPELFPGAYEALRQILVLPWNERLHEVHVEYLARKIKRAAEVE